MFGHPPEMVAHITKVAAETAAGALRRAAVQVAAGLTAACAAFQCCFTLSGHARRAPLPSTWARLQLAYECQALGVHVTKVAAKLAAGALRRAAVQVATGVTAAFAAIS